jgi:hypothetical protein
MTFEDLPVGACFAFEAATKHATRRKFDERHTITIPGGKRPLIMHDLDTLVVSKSCPTSFGRRRRRNKRSR